MTDDNPTPAEVRESMKCARTKLPPYNLEYAPLPVDRISRVGRKPMHNVQETIVLFYESGKPSACVGGPGPDRPQSLADGIWVLGLRYIVRAKSIGDSVWLYRLDMPQPEGFKP